MAGIEGLFGMLDGRPFVSLWYWLLLTGLWTWLGRGALGIPSDLVAAVRRLDRQADPGTGDYHLSTTLLDWLSLVTPRWRVGRGESVVLIAAATFVVTVLTVLGFVYDLATAQGLSLLTGPLAILVVLRVRLAAGLSRTLAQAETGQLSAPAAASAAARRIARHMRLTTMLSILAVSASALWGVHWIIQHPNGL